MFEGGVCIVFIVDFGEEFLKKFMVGKFFSEFMFFKIRKSFKDRKEKVFGIKIGKEAIGKDFLSGSEKVRKFVIYLYFLKYVYVMFYIY